MTQKKPKLKKRTMRVLDDTAERCVEVSEGGVPGLFQPGEWDINEELQCNEALRERQRNDTEDI